MVREGGDYAGGFFGGDAAACAPEEVARLEHGAEVCGEGLVEGSVGFGVEHSGGWVCCHDALC